MFDRGSNAGAPKRASVARSGEHLGEFPYLPEPFGEHF